MPNTGKPWYRILYIQVLIGVALGILTGVFFPEIGKSVKPLGDAFVKLVKMMIAPIIFCTVVHGIASMSDMRKLGRVGFKTLLYFEVVSTFALIIGLVVVNILKPGVGFNIDPASLDSSLTRGYAEKANSHSMVDFIMNIIPTTIFSPFFNGDLLQVLFISIMTAFAITCMGERARPILEVIDTGSKVFFNLMNILVKFAPIGAFGAMGFTIANYGLSALGKLLELMIGFYITSALFVFIVLGFISWMMGFSILRYLSYIKEELLLVLGTSSSETALPGMMEKSIKLGCSKSTVGLVIPSGYSFNLDGTNIYLCMAAIFLAQATNTPLDLRQQITLLLVAMISSKGSSGVTGAGFITLAATLATIPSIPVASLSLLVGIDRFMSECRAITNLIGNGVATVVISRWEGELTKEQLNECLQK